MTDVSILATLDSALRGAAIALFLLVAGLTLRSGRGTAAARLGALLSAGAASYVVCSAPSHHGHFSPWLAPILALCVGNAVVFWLFTRAVFDDSFRPHAHHAAIWAVLVASSLLGLFGVIATIATASLVCGFVSKAAPPALALLALVQTIKDWRSDLVEGRRRLRLFIVAATAAYIIIVGTVEFMLGGERAPVPLDALNAAGLAAIAATVAALLLRADVAAVMAGQAGDAAIPVETPSVSDREAARGQSADPRLLAELDRLMTMERAYRQEGLTIGALATSLGVPERRLRLTINGGLGYRNFNEYLNRQRIAEAKLALADPTQAEVPILTIALDAGFQSLGPFNRAFKTDTGMTPTEFRRASRARNGA